MGKQANRRLHESTSRALCRLAFIALGVVPVMACLGASSIQLLPHYQQWRASVWEQRLSSLLGFTVHIGSLDEPSPTQATLRGIRLLHPESKASFARAETVEIALYRGQWLVRVQQAELEGRQLGEHWQLLHESLLCRPRSSACDAHLEFDQVQLHSREGLQRVHDVSLKVSPNVEKTCLWLDFHVGEDLPDDSAQTQITAEPIRLSLIRSHQEQHRATKGQLRTASHRLPCRLLRPFWQDAEGFGSAATVTGVLDWYSTAEHWRVTVPESGLLFEQVDFERLTWNAPAEVSGSGKLRLTDVVITERGVQQLSGVARVGLGRINKRLLLDAETHLGLQLQPSVRQQATREIAFEDACLGFEISPAYLRLAGLLPVGGVQTDGLLLDANGIIARAPYSTWPLTHLVKAVDRAPAENQQVPAGLLARTLLAWLPLEEDAAEHTADAAMRLTVQ